MIDKKQIPHHNSPSEAAEERVDAGRASIEDAAPRVTERGAVQPAGSSSTPAHEEAQGETLEEWRDRALRLQAEMENYRKRQRRLAEEQVRAERERLLGALLPIADDLARALKAATVDLSDIQQGVALTYQNLLRLLEREGVERIEAEGRSFDPLWHEAVGTVSTETVAVEPNTVVSVMEEGYRLDGRVLRPARVVIAV